MHKPEKNGDLEENLIPYMKDPAKGQDQAIGGNSNAYIFLPIGDTPINVYIERKLRLWRFQKFKNLWIFYAFLYPKR